MVLETVRTILAEWITVSVREPNWEPDICTAIVDFCTKEALEHPEYLTWLCQRKVWSIFSRKHSVKSWKENKNLPGQPSLIMLFILGFPVLRMESVPDYEVSAQQETITAIHVSVQTWGAWTPIAPGNISLEIRVDKTNQKLSLRLVNNSSTRKFRWQDWVDAAMDCLKGFEMAQE